jgi:hypothetical protein
MKLLLDTHVVLWWLDDPGLLSKDARDAIAEPANEVMTGLRTDSSPGHPAESANRTASAGQAVPIV